MTPEAQRIAIAEACGIKRQQDRWFNPRTKRHAIDLPDYLNDLNACHEMEARLGDKQQEYAMALLLIQRRDEAYSDVRRSELQKTFDCIHATAAQRTEAFLKTLNLWKE